MDELARFVHTEVTLGAVTRRIQIPNASVKVTLGRTMLHALVAHHVVMLT